MQSNELWACMACMALHGKNLKLAEESLAAIHEVIRPERTTCAFCLLLVVLLILLSSLVPDIAQKELA